MKKISALITLFLMLPFLGHAQCTDPTVTMKKPPFPASLFPFGTFDCDNTINEWSPNWCNVINTFNDGRFNVMWFSTTGHKWYQYMLAKSFIPGTYMYKGEHSFAFWNTLSPTDDQNNFGFPVSTAGPVYNADAAFENRYFLVKDGINDGAFDYDNHETYSHWYDDQADGFISSSHYRSLLNTSEWEIDPSSGAVPVIQFTIDNKKSTNDALGSGADASVLGSLGATYNGDPYPNNDFLDLVYRIDGSAPSGTIFSVTVQVTKWNSSGTQEYQHTDPPINIALSDYNNYVNSTPNATSDPKGLRTFQGHNYAVIRIGGDVDATLANAIYIPPADADAKDHRQVAVTITSNGAGTFYIRGLRFRSKSCDDILRGNCLADLQTKFQTILSQLNSDARSGAGQVNAIVGQGEQNSLTLRAYAYMDDQFNKYTTGNQWFNKYSGGKHIYEFMNGQESQYRAIYDDQNDYPPPVLMKEDYAPTGKDAAWNSNPHSPPPFPQDGIPWDVLHPEQFSQLNATTWWPSDYLGNGYTFDDLGFGVAQPVLADYNNYTSVVQSQMSGLFANDHQVGIAAYQHGTASSWQDLVWEDAVPWGGNAKLRNVTDQRFIMQVREPYISWLKAPVGLPPAFSLYDLLADGQVSTHEVDDGSHSGTRTLLSGPNGYNPADNNNSYFSGSATKYELSNRQSMPWEQRAQAWSGLTSGAKGIYLNVIGTDRGNNIGITDENGYHNYDGIVMPQNMNYLGTILPSNTLKGIQGPATFGNNFQPFIGYDPTGDPNLNYPYHLIHYTGSGQLSATLVVPGRGSVNKILNNWQWIPVSVGGNAIGTGDISNINNLVSPLTLFGWDGANGGEWDQGTGTLPSPNQWEAVPQTSGNNPIGDEVQILSITSQPPAGYTFIISFRGQTLTDLSYSISASTLQQSLNSLSSISSVGGTVTCTGGPLNTNPISIEFTEKLGDSPVELLQLSTSASQLYVQISEQTQGVHWFSGFNNQNGENAPPPMPSDQISLIGWLPTYTGFNQSFTMAQRIEKDIEPIVPILAKLSWKGSIRLQPQVNSGGSNGSVPYTDPTFEWKADPSSEQDAIGNWTLYDIPNNGNFQSDWHNYPIMEDIFDLAAASTSPGAPPIPTGIDHPPYFQDRTFQKVRRYDYPYTVRDPGDWFENVTTYTDYNTGLDGTNYDDIVGQNVPWSFDLSANRYLTLGRFINSDEPDAFYVAFSNPRTWPVRYDVPWSPGSQWNPSSILKTDHTESLLGDIDRRRINFKLRDAIVDPNQTGQKWFTVTNLRTGDETTLDITQHYNAGLQTDVFHVDLDPGEGTLVRIGPATAIGTGRTNYAGIAYNNGNRTALVGPPCATAQRAIVWDSNGCVRFALTQPAGTGDAVYNPAPIPVTIFPTAAWPLNPHDSAHDPSIACSGNTIGVVYSVDDYNTTSERSIIFACSNNNGITWTSNIIAGTIDGNSSTPPVNLTYYHPNIVDVTGNGWDLATPVITPVQDGFVIAYANNRDIHPYWVHFDQGQNKWVWNPLLTPTPGLATTDLRMPSLASRDDFSGSLYERIHLCYEYDFANGHSTVAYWPIIHTLGTAAFMYGSFTPLGWAVEVSRGYPHCYNYHPHVAVINDSSGISGNLGLPIVTWEATDPPLLPEDCFGFPQPIYNIFCSWHTSAAVRYMTAPGNHHASTIWSEITTFHSETGNLPQPVVRPLDNLCSGGPTLTEFAEVAYQDTFSHQEFIARLTSPWDVRPITWSINHLEENAQWGSVSLPYEKEPLEDFGSILYRGTYSDPNGLYPIKIVANPDPLHSDEVSAPTEQKLVYILSAGPIPGGPSPCGPPPIYIKIGSGPCLPCNGTVQPGGIPVITPPFLNHPLADFIESAIPYDNTQITGGNYDSTGQSYNDSIATMVEQPAWPLTEDSIRTNYFQANQQEVISLKRLLIVDTTQLHTWLTSVNNRVSYKLVLKDSASRQIITVLDSAIIEGQLPTGGSYSGVNPNDSTMTGMGYRIYDTIPPSPSGSAYITAIITKDSATIANLISEESYGDTIDFPVPVLDSSSDSGAFKKSQPQPQSTGVAESSLNVTVHPNPTRSKVRICVADLAPGIQATVDVVDELGNQVAILYNAIPDAELGLCLTLDCSQLPSGVYYADLQANGSHKAVQFSVEH